MAWIAYNKTFDMDTTLMDIGMSRTVCNRNEYQKMLEISINHWKPELHSGDQRLEEVNIGRGIFQGHCLTSLLFIIGLIPLSNIVKTSQSLEKALSSITYCTWMILNFMEKKRI